MKNARQLLGSYGEARAAAHLEALGYEIIDRNWRSALGEIDLVARRGNCISVIEVKTRRGSIASAFEAITPAKAARLRVLAYSWCQERGLTSVDISIDAIAVSLAGGRVSVEHLDRVA
jgi:putative endonuclease